MPVIVVSGKPEAGASTTAKLLAKILKLRCFSVGDYVKSLGPKKEITSENSNAFMKSEEGKSRYVHEGIDKMQLKEAMKGNVVIDSKLGIFILKDKFDFSVWLKCPKHVRIKRLAKRDKLDEKEAVNVIREKEFVEMNNYKEIYGINPYDLEMEADFVIDNSRKEPVKVVHEIIEEMKRKRLI